MYEKHRIHGYIIFDDGESINLSFATYHQRLAEFVHVHTVEIQEDEDYLYLLKIIGDTLAEHYKAPLSIKFDIINEPNVRWDILQNNIVLFGEPLYVTLQVKQEKTKTHQGGITLNDSDMVVLYEFVELTQN